jgi:hypothetical protein
MQFTTAVTMAALALGSNAAVLGKRQTEPAGVIAQFRTFSGTDCVAGNNGFTQVYNTTQGVCSTFNGDSVYSVDLEYLTNGGTSKYLDTSLSSLPLALTYLLCSVSL